MLKSIEAVFDGEVFRPDTVPDLEPNTRCIILIQEARLPAELQAEMEGWDRASAEAWAMIDDWEREAETP